MNEYMLGNLFGITQVITGYPFDTLKTNIQNHKPITSFLKKPLSLYTGVRYPLMTTMLGTTFMFGNYSQFLEYTNNKLIAASMTGILGAFLITPFDYLKIQHQIIAHRSNNTNIHLEINHILDKNHNNILKLIPSRISLYYSGLPYTILRESIAIPAYFLTFDIMYYDGKISPFISGAMAGVNSWFFTYPLDTIKSRRQLYPNKPIRELIAIGNLYNGLGITLLRAIIVNGLGFQLYTHLKQNDYYTTK